MLQHKIKQSAFTISIEKPFVPVIIKIKRFIPEDFFFGKGTDLPRYYLFFCFSRNDRKFPFHLSSNESDMN